MHRTVRQEVNCHTFLKAILIQKEITKRVPSVKPSQESSYYTGLMGIGNSVVFYGVLEVISKLSGEWTARVDCTYQEILVLGRVWSVVVLTAKTLDEITMMQIARVTYTSLLLRKIYGYTFSIQTSCHTPQSGASAKEPFSRCLEISSGDQQEQTRKNNVKLCLFVLFLGW